MSSYRKTMGEVYNGMYLVEGNIDKIKDIVSKKQHTKIDGVMVDLFTASAISQIYDKVNDANKKKMEKLPITKLATLAMKMMKNEYVPEELDLDEASPQFDLLKKYGTTIMKMWDKEGKSSDEIAKKLSLNSKDIKTLKGLMDEELDLDEGTWHIAKNMNALKKKMQKPIPKNDLMVKFVMKHIGDDVLADEMFDAKTGTDMVPMIKSAMKRLNIKEEVDLDESVIEQLKSLAKGGSRYKPKSGAVEIKDDKGKVINKLTPEGAKKVLDKMKDPISGKSSVPDRTRGGAEKKIIDIVKNFKEEVDLDEAFDFVLLDKDNKIAGRYSGSNAKKEAESGKKSAHLPPMRIPKNEVGKMKIVPISPKDKKGIGDTVLAIGEKLDKDDEIIVKKVVDKLKKASQAHAGQSKDLQKAIDEDGHTDVASAQNNVKVATAALTKMSGELAKLSPEDALPSWWTNKVAVAVDKLDGMADYLDTQVEEKDDFRPHMMYDPKTGKGYKANTMDDHLRMTKMGYTHDAPKKEEADLDEASARGDAKRSMRRDRDFGRKDDLDKDDAASDDDVKAASKNIMMQLRKAANLRGTFAVEFGDKKKVKVDPKVAQAAASKYNSLRRPADKEKFQSQIAKSYKDMLKAIKEAVSPAQQAAIAISKKERGEKPKKESKFSTINKQLKGEK